MLKKKIMIVNNDVDFLGELKDALSFTGYDSIIVHDNNMALGVAIREKPDVILLDIKTKDSDSFKLVEQLKLFPETVGLPVIAMSECFAGHEHSSLIDLYGVSACLKKPFTPLDVISHVEMLSSSGNKWASPY
jgi:DNA-binding response OmpR family regulator